jgi:hypothetical protein
VNARFERIKVPYPMPPAVSEAKREEFMAWAVKQNLPKIAAKEIGTGIMTIVGYGPSLSDTWRKIEPPLICTSNSLKFLIGKGLKPGLGWFYAMADPRPNNLDFIRNPVISEVTYLMASVCHPKVWKILAGQKVILWHAMSGEHTPEWVRVNDPGTWLVGAGSTIGLCAIHLGGFLGFRKFEIHGFDGSFRDGKRHAGEHNGHDQAPIESTINPAFTTSKIMDNANVEVQNTLKSFPIFCVFHGEGLMQDWVSKVNLANAALDGTEKAKSVRRSSFVEVTREQVTALKKAGVPLL